MNGSRQGTGRSADEAQATDLMRGIVEMREEMDLLSRRIDAAASALTSSWQAEGSRNRP